MFTTFPYDTFTIGMFYNNVLYPLVKTTLKPNEQELFKPTIYKTHCTSNYSGYISKQTINNVVYDTCLNSNFQYGETWKYTDSTYGGKSYYFSFVFAENEGIGTEYIITKKSKENNFYSVSNYTISSLYFNMI